MSAEHVEARPGAYADSVTLMQASTDVRKADGVEAALIAMATELNLGLLAEMGFAAPPQAGPNDLLIAVRATDDATLTGALAAVDTALAPHRAAHDGAAVQQPPRTAAAPGGAARAGAGPGADGTRCRGDGRSTPTVTLRSSDTPVEQEITAQRHRRGAGPLVRPDCGTAVVGGVGLASRTPSRREIGLPPPPAPARRC